MLLNADSWTSFGCPELTAPVINCTRPAKDQARQTSSMDWGGAPRGFPFARGNIGSCWMLREDESLSFGNVAASKLTMPQWMITHP